MDDQPLAVGSSATVGVPEDTQSLRGRLGVLELVLMVLAWSGPLVVVAGITGFIVGFAQTGAPVAFGAAMVALVLFAVGFVAMTHYVENPGAFYAYITAGLGKAAGLGSGFLAFCGYFVLGVGTIGFFGVASKGLVEGTLHGPSIPWYVYGLFCVALIGTLGYFRIDLSAKVLAVAMLLEVGLVAIFDLAVLIFDGGPEGLSAEPFTWDAATSGSIGLAILFAATCFSGFETTAVFREEAKDPRRTVARATYAAVISIGVFYVVSTYAVVIAYGPSKVTEVATANPAGIFFDAMDQYVGTWAKDAIAILIVTSAFAAMLSCQNILARYAYALAEDGALPEWLAQVHPTHGSPAKSSLAVTGLFLAAVLLMIALVDDIVIFYAKLLGMGGLALIALMTLTGIAIVVFFQRRREIDEPIVKTLLAPVLSVLALGAICYLAITNFELLTGGSSAEARLMLGVLAAVFVFGFVLALVYRASRPDTYARIGRQSIM